MAYVGSTNVLGNNTTGAFFFNLKTALFTAGWTIVSSGTGTSGTTGAGDLLPTAASFQVANAWVRVREPGAGTREYVFQNGNANNSTNGIVKYSRATGFGTGGTATVAPTTGGGDGVVFIGGGTDAAPTQIAVMNATNGYLQAIASDTPVNGVYGFWAFYYQVSPVANMWLLGTEAVAAGSTPSNDADPSLRYSGLAGNISNTSGTWQWWEAYGLGGATYRTGGWPGQYVGYTAPSYANLWPAFTGLDPYQGKVAMFPMLAGKGATCLPKGFTTGLASFGVAPNLLDTYNLTSSEPKVCLSLSSPTYYAVPWVPNVVPLV